MMKKTIVLAALLAAAPLLAAPDSSSYERVIQETASMVRDSDCVKAARDHGMQILNLTWEDTGRFKGSAVGPNISDMTLQIQHENKLTCLPVIRFPNFEDKTADLKMEDFYLLVGNEKGAPLKRITLKEYLGDLRRYLSTPKSWKGDRKSLLAANRDSHVLVSAQACFLPIPKKGKAEFNPVLFNYQSYKENPAVLAILATREGTSATIIDNTRDGFSAGNGAWGQRLFFNQDGERASLTGERLSDFKGGSDTSVSAGGQRGLNMVLLIQVPLKQKNPPRHAAGMLDYCAAPCAEAASMKSRGRSDVEVAVVGHGKVEGPFTEIDDLEIERDDRFPVRVTVQFYKATSNGVVDEKDMASIASQINQVYADGDYVGSLVTGGETDRPTEHDGPKKQPAHWWKDFWSHYREHLAGPSGDVWQYFRKKP